MLRALLNRMGWRRSPSPGNLAPPAERAPDAESNFDPGQIVALVQTGAITEATNRLEQRLKGMPADVDALHLLGLVRLESNRISDAVELIGRAVALAPGLAHLHANLAQALRSQGDLAQAESRARESVHLDPDNADYRANLAIILAAGGRLPEANELATRVLGAQPDRIDMLALNADACFHLGRIEEAVKLAARASTLAPQRLALLASLMRLRAWACDWDSRTADERRCVALLDEAAARAIRTGDPGELRQMNPFFTYEYPIPQRLRDAATDAYAAGVLREAGERLDPDAPTGSGPGQRLRVGYVSADFHGHPTMHLMSSFFGLHDRARFEIFAYSIGPDDGSPYRRRARETVDHFIDIRDEAPRRSAERIRSDGIDILVDLKGFTHEARPAIFALRPAPLRVAWLGYPASTGRHLNDYALVDAITVPEALASQFGEKLIRMPHSYQVNDHLQAVPDAPPARASLGLPDSGFVFVNFNHVYKIEPDVFGCWMRILKRTPGSVLWLYCDHAMPRNRLAHAAAEAGVGPERIIFASTADKPRHLARLRCADLFLDTATINAHTSASDALWAGVPVLTRPGDAFPARVAASLVAAAGLPQLICADFRQYEDAAVRLASAPEELSGMRASLQARSRLPLFDTPRFVRAVESAYEHIWSRHKRGEPPASFAVSDDPPAG